MSKKQYRIAVIPGDGIGKEVMPEGLRVIEAFNQDRPYARFVQEQVAGDVLFPDDPRGIVATGFIAAGPWDESSQQSIRDDTLDKKVAQTLDRDDMLTTVMGTLTSTTIHCARCHNH